MNFWLLKVCKKRLFSISGIQTRDIDCCRKGEYTHWWYYNIKANQVMVTGYLAFTRQYEHLDKCPACQTPRRDSNNRSQQSRYIPLQHRIKLMYAKRSLAKTLRTYRATLQDVSKSTGQISDIW